MKRGTRLLCVIVLCLLGAAILIPFFSSLVTLAHVVDVGRPTPHVLLVAASIALVIFIVWYRMYVSVWWEDRRRHNPQAHDLDVLVHRLEQAADNAFRVAASAEAVGISGRRVRRAGRVALRAQKAVSELTWVRRHIDMQPPPMNVEDMQTAQTARSVVLRNGWRTLDRTLSVVSEANALVMAEVRHRSRSAAATLTPRVSWAVRGLIYAAAKLLPAPYSGRYHEEWLSLLYEVPRRIGRVRQTLSLLLGTPRLWWTLRRSSKGDLDHWIT